MQKIIKNLTHIKNELKNRRIINGLKTITMIIELSQKNAQTIYDCLMDVVYRMRDFHKSYFEGRDVDEIEYLANYIRFAKEQSTNSEGSVS